jgi:hypothetical protein
MSKKSSPVKIRFGHLEFIKLNADHWNQVIKFPSFIWQAKAAIPNN